MHRSACVDGVTNPSVQLQFAQSSSLSLPDHLPQQQLGLTCLLQVAGIPLTGIVETNMPHCLRAETHQLCHL